MAVDDYLRNQSKQLLEKLKAKQGSLKQTVAGPRSKEFKLHSDTLTLGDLEIGKNSIGKAKDSLCSKANPSSRYHFREFQENESFGKSNEQGTKRLSQGVVTPDCSVDKEFSVSNGDNDLYQTRDVNNSSTCTTPVKSGDSESGRIRTPTSVRRGRQIIDRNVRVGTNSVRTHREGDQSTFLLSADRPHNYTSHYGLAGTEGAPPSIESTKPRQNPRGCGPYSRDQPESSDEENNCYYRKLTDGGNDRKKLNFIKDTTLKPKSILNSSGPYGPKKRSGSFSKVSFRDTSASGRTSPSFLEDKTSKQLLGYDWIAGLIDNDPTIIDQSEAFFEELRDFRRVNRQECENRAYMEGPLCVVRASEPSVVQEALETKVKPFTVNDRLFTVPVNNDMLASYVGEPTEDTVENKEPSYEAPRFVRVSIPRSTLVSPHRYKPHRRRSFDPTDSMALGEHCLLGWESSRPATLPTASNIALKDATKGIQTQIATTLEEAEKVASSFYWPNSGPPGEVYKDQRIRKDTLLQQRYNSLLDGLQSKGGHSDAPATGLADQTLSTGDDSIQFSYSIPKSRKPTNGFSKSSDQLLNSTYSLIYEMERLKQEADARLKVPAL